MYNIIICGNDRVGKSTLSKQLQLMLLRRNKIQSVRLSISDPLRAELVNLYGIPRDIIDDKHINKDEVILQLGDYEFNEQVPIWFKQIKLIRNVEDYSKLSVSLRELFNIHGTHIRRQQDEKYWHKQLSIRTDMAFADPNCKICIYDDFRNSSDFDFPNRFIIHLFNNIIPTKENHAQTTLNKWIKQNKQHINLSLQVPVPYLQLQAENDSKKIVIPHLEECGIL